MILDAPPLQIVRALFPPQLHDRIFLVGGAVRDLLLGHAGVDIDLVVALPERELLSRKFRPVTPRSAAPIFFRPFGDGSKIEVTRIDRPLQLEADLRQRDFTVNAIALDLDGRLIDPLAGRRDLTIRTLRLCAVTAFDDDPGRIWRALRFESHGWRLDDTAREGLQRRDWNKELNALPIERFSQEMIKALAGREPTRFFAQMLACNLGRTLLPELFRMPHVPAGPSEHHPEGDLFTHCCQVVERIIPLSSAPLARFCAFFHDLGKLATPPDAYPRHHGHDELGAQLAEPFCNRLALPASWRKALACICRHHGSANRWDETRDSTRIRIADACIKAQVAELLPLIAVADYPCGPGLPDWPAALVAARATATGLGIDPTALERIPPADRSGYLMQRRVEQLRAARRQGILTSDESAIG